MTDTRWIARLLKWLFAFCTVVCVVAAVAVVVVMAIDPKLPNLGHHATVNLKIMGQNATLVIANTTAAADMLAGNVRMKVDDLEGLFHIIIRYGLPLALLFTLFYAGLFDLLRRLFRNVVRGDSFTRKTVLLVQAIGLALVVFSFVSAAAEGWFEYALTSYLSQHASASIASAPVHLPASAFTIDSDNGFVFGNSLFFTGLLVLALSEVFRQGLMLKNDNDLTI